MEYLFQYTFKKKLPSFGFFREKLYIFCQNLANFISNFSKKVKNLALNFFTVDIQKYREKNGKEKFKVLIVGNSLKFSVRNFYDDNDILPMKGLSPDSRLTMMDGNPVT